MITHFSRDIIINMGKVSKHTVTKIINVKRDVKQPGLFRSHRHSTTGLTHLTAHNRHHHHSHHHNHSHHRLQPPSLLPPPTLLLPPASQQKRHCSRRPQPSPPDLSIPLESPHPPLGHFTPAHRQDWSERARRPSRCCAGARGIAWYRHH